MSLTQTSSLIVNAASWDLQDIAGLSHWLSEAKALSRAPISQFQVGAIAIGQSGQAYLGTNLEFLNQPLSQTVHAEQFALTLARLHGEQQIKALVVSALPCGHCRQFLQELHQSDLPILVIDNADHQQYRLQDLLPHPFTLADEDHHLLSPMITPLELVEDTKDVLAVPALKAASLSYSPYTHCYSGVALKTAEDRVFSGSRLESAAFNPTLPSLQAALIHLVSEHVDYQDIQEIILVESIENTTSATGATWNLLKSISPLAKMSFIEARIQDPG